ncbi:hypothetical protein [Aeromicrobium sp.]|uniref:hypothetical protein n=1 Tax=Aeromicrobium sp. TaxID=1871063 RepID=UPI003D6A55E7
MATLTTAHAPAATCMSARSVVRVTGLSGLFDDRVTTASQSTKSAVTGEARTSMNAKL